MPFDTSSRARLADTQATVKRSDLSPYAHAVIRHPHPGLPSTLLFVSAEAELLFVRALIRLDGELVVMPMSYYAETGSYQATFPAPSESLSYRFQLELPDGRTVLTALHRAEGSCDGQLLSANTREEFPGQRAMIARAVALERELAAISLSRNLLKRIGAAGEGESEPNAQVALDADPSPAEIKTQIEAADRGQLRVYLEVPAKRELLAATVIVVTPPQSDDALQRPALVQKEAMITRVSPGLWRLRADLARDEYGAGAVATAIALDASGNTVTWPSSDISEAAARSAAIGGTASDSTSDAARQAAASQSFHRCRPTKSRLPVPLQDLGQKELAQIIELREKRLSLTRRLLEKELTPQTLTEIAARERRRGILPRETAIVGSASRLAARLIIIDELEKAAAASEARAL